MVLFPLTTPYLGMTVSFLTSWWGSIKVLPWKIFWLSFRIDPDSMRQVLIPTDGLESTTQGKYNKEDWMVFITFQKYLEVSILLKLMDFFYLYSELIFAEQPFLRERGKVWANFDLASSCPWFLQFSYWENALNFPSSDFTRISFFCGHKPKACNESSVSTRIRILPA